MYIDLKITFIVNMQISMLESNIPLPNYVAVSSWFMLLRCRAGGLQAIRQDVFLETDKSVNISTYNSHAIQMHHTCP